MACTSWVSLATMKPLEPGVRLNLFAIMPQNDRWIGGFFWVFFFRCAAHDRLYSLVLAAQLFSWPGFSSSREIPS